MGTVHGARHPRRRGSRRTARADRRAGRGARRARRRAARRVRRRRRPSPRRRLRAALRRADPARAQVHPVFFGSAITGAGVAELLTAGIAELLPAAARRPGRPASPARCSRWSGGRPGRRSPTSRMFAGTVRVRDRVPFGATARDGKVTAIGVFDARRGRRARPRCARGRSASCGACADVRIGDPIGARRAPAAEHHFAPPTLETVVVPARPARPGRAARRAHPARRAGPADRPAPRRRAPGDLRVALRRGAEGGHRRPRWPTSTAWT